MIDSVFGNLDREKTTEAFKGYLKEWKKWKLKALQRFPGVRSPSMDGQPNDGTPHDPDAKFVGFASADYEYKTRVKCCTVLMSVGEEEEILGGHTTSPLYQRVVSYSDYAVYQRPLQYLLGR